jgi:hypothetical protein
MALTRRTNARFVIAYAWPGGWLLRNRPIKGFQRIFSDHRIIVATMKVVKIVGYKEDSKGARSPSDAPRFLGRLFQKRSPKTDTVASPKVRMGVVERFSPLPEWDESKTDTSKMSNTESTSPSTTFLDDSIESTQTRFGPVQVGSTLDIDQSSLAASFQENESFKQLDVAEMCRHQTGLETALEESNLVLRASSRRRQNTQNGIDKGRGTEMAFSPKREPGSARANERADSTRPSSSFKPNECGAWIMSDPSTLSKLHNDTSFRATSNHLNREDTPWTHEMGNLNLANNACEWLQPGDMPPYGRPIAEIQVPEEAKLANRSNDMYTHSTKVNRPHTFTQNEFDGQRDVREEIFQSFAQDETILDLHPDASSGDQKADSTAQSREWRASHVSGVVPSRNKSSSPDLDTNFLPEEKKDDDSDRLMSFKEMSIDELAASRATEDEEYLHELCDEPSSHSDIDLFDGEPEVKPHMLFGAVQPVHDNEPDQDSIMNFFSDDEHLFATQPLPEKLGSRRKKKKKKRSMDISNSSTTAYRDSARGRTESPAEAVNDTLFMCGAMAGLDSCHSGVRHADESVCSDDSEEFSTILREEFGRNRTSSELLREIRSELIDTVQVLARGGSSVLKTIMKEINKEANRV